MNEAELRTLVREVIARYSAGSASPNPPPSGLTRHAIRHASHGLFPVDPGAAGDGACLIESAVRCNHCGYCRSLGH